MSRSSRVVALTITSVLTISAFVGLWLTKPGENNSVLEEARKRQTQALIQVNEPLKTDVKEIAEEEAFAEEVQAIILNDESFKTKLAEELVTNDVFIQAVKDTVKPEVQAEVDSLVASYVSIYEPIIISLIEEKVDVLKVDMDELASELITPVSTAIYGRFTADYSPEIIAQRVLDEVNRELIDSKNEAFAYVDKKTALEAADIEPFVVDVYNKYSSEVVSDITDRIMQALEKALSELESKVDEATATANAAVEKAKDAEAEAAKLKESEVRSHIIKAPDFSSVKVVDEADYAAVRKEQRDAVLKAVIDAIGE